MSDEFSDAIRDAIWHELSGKVHTALPAVVNKYDPTTVTVEAMPLLKKRYLDGQELSFKPIIDVPVIFPRTNRFHCSFPLERGDTVLLVFSERSLENWLKDGGEVTPNSGRKFALSDAIAIPGLFAFKKGNPILSGDNFELVFDDVKIVSNGTTLELTGDVRINGKLDVTEEVTGNNISLSAHVHGTDVPPLTPNGTLANASPAGPVTGTTAGPSNPLVP